MQLEYYIGGVAIAALVVATRAWYMARASLRRHGVGRKQTREELELARAAAAAYDFEQRVKEAALERDRRRRAELGPG